MNVINGPDLLLRIAGFESHNVDTYGHGTHLAGFVPQDATSRSTPPTKEDEEIDRYFVGAAPGARIVNVKVAASDGATDVSQVIAAIDWVVQNRERGWSEHPRSEPIVRNRRHPGLSVGPSRLRG